MKRIAALALLTIACLATSTGAHAQTYGLNAKIPFDFTVGNTWMPAGEYRISAPTNSTMQLRGTSNGSIATVVSNPGHHEAKSGSQLVFHRYGNRFFLNRIQCSGNSSLNLDIAQGKAEKEEVAKVRTGQEVLVATNKK